jgi:hypothetical protein
MHRSWSDTKTPVWFNLVQNDHAPSFGRLSQSQEQLNRKRGRFWTFHLGIKPLQFHYYSIPEQPYAWFSPRHLQQITFSYKNNVYQTYNMVLPTDYRFQQYHILIVLCCRYITLIHPQQSKQPNTTSLEQTNFMLTAQLFGLLLLNHFFNLSSYFT